MYIRADGLVKDLKFVSTEDILATVFSVTPQCVCTPILSYDFFNYINTIPTHCNDIILRGIEAYFSHIIEKNFIEVVEDCSFDYEYGDICSTHHEDATIGYVRRTQEMEELACEGPWDDDYFW